MNRDEIIKYYDIKDVARSYGLKVSNNGKCRCPFHGDDKHPSMQFYKERYICFACNEKGTVIDLVMKFENMTFTEAYNKLGGDKNFDPKNYKRKELVRTKFKSKEKVSVIKLQDTLAWACRLADFFRGESHLAVYYHEILDSIYHDRFVNGKVPEPYGKPMYDYQIMDLCNRYVNRQIKELGYV